MILILSFLFVPGLGCFWPLSARGVYQIWNSYFYLPPFLIYIFSSTKIYNEGAGAAGEKCSVQPFSCNFVYFKSIGEKISILFTNWGKNMHFPPVFYPLSIIIFPPTWYLAIFLPPPPGEGGGIKQKNIHPCFQAKQIEEKKSGAVVAPLSSLLGEKFAKLDK